MQNKHNIKRKKNQAERMKNTVHMKSEIKKEWKQREHDMTSVSTTLACVRTRKDRKRDSKEASKQRKGSSKKARKPECKEAKKQESKKEKQERTKARKQEGQKATGRTRAAGMRRHREARAPSRAWRWRRRCRGRGVRACGAAPRSSAACASQHCGTACRAARSTYILKIEQKKTFRKLNCIT